MVQAEAHGVVKVAFASGDVLTLMSRESATNDACVAACRPQDMAPAVLDRLTACVAGCRDGGDDDRATCRLICAQSATP